MNFVQTLEDCLRDLASQAYRSNHKHPGVKEASERATLQLRMLQNKYVSAVRQASTTQQHPTTAIFQSSDLLHPFLLAANYPNASIQLLDTSFGAMRLLMDANAIVPSDALHMVRVWMIQAQVVVSYYQKLYNTTNVTHNNSSNNNNNQGDNNRQSTAHHEHKRESDSLASSSRRKPSGSSSSSSSWFAWGTSKIYNGVTNNTSGSNSSSNNHYNDAKSTIKNAVSSSGGQTGQSLSQQSAKDMERLALGILSSLLQLLNLLPQPQLEVWSNAVALTCLWFPYLPIRHTIQQAAHSTLTQILSLLVQSSDAASDDDKYITFINDTWNDLLTLATLTSTIEPREPQQSTKLKGAFSLCTKSHQSIVGTSSTGSCPPPPSLAIELMTTWWKEKPCVSANVLQTLQSSTRLLQQTRTVSVERVVRIMNWTLVLLQTSYTQENYLLEARELLLVVLQPIVMATEQCRLHPDFSDGYVYVSGHANGATAFMHDQGLTMLIPFHISWKAALAIETIYHLLPLQPLCQDVSILSTIAETLSDWCTMATSGKNHVVQLVDFWEGTYDNTQPAVLRKAESAIVSGVWEDDGSSDNGNNNRTGSNSSATMSASNDKKSNAFGVANSVFGESLWLSFKAIMRIADILKNETEYSSSVGETVTSILAVLQHYLKRLSGLPIAVEENLAGYASLAFVCMNPAFHCPVQRKAVLTSLCKSCLPSWGKHDSSAQLQDHHVRTLLCLLRILHLHHKSIATEWEILLWTFQELSVLSIASPLLSEEAYHGALAVAAVYQRFGSFSTCLDTESLLQMASALTEIGQVLMEKRDVAGSTDIILPDRGTSSTGTNDKTVPDSKESIGGRLVSMGVRVIYGAGEDEYDDADNQYKADRTRNTFYEEYRQDFSKRISASTLRLRLSSISTIPFVIILLADVAMTNAFRYKDCGEFIGKEITKLAASSPAVRPFAMDLIAMLTMSHISHDNIALSPFAGPGKVMLDDPMQSQLLAVEPTIIGRYVERETVAHKDLLSPLCDTMKMTQKVDVAESALATLTLIIEGSGHHFDGNVWYLIVEAIMSLSGDPKYCVDRSAACWTKCCTDAFRSLKLVVDNFADEFRHKQDARELLSCLFACCSAFGRSRHDINTSLTAVGLIWTIADQDIGPDTIDEALTNLLALSMDNRPEARNAAANTLFLCISGRCKVFTARHWKSCFREKIFHLYDYVNARSVDSSEYSNDDDDKINGKNNNRYQVSLHHSRSSASKQWMATQVIVLRGLLRVLRNFFSVFLTSPEGDASDNDDNGVPWFQEAWVKILDYGYEAAVVSGQRDTLDFRLTGVEILVVCVQLSSSAGITAANTTARVSTNMEVVNGALRSVKQSEIDPPKTLLVDIPRSSDVEAFRQELFLESFESLESARDVYANLQEVDDLYMQVLHKFILGLVSVYECCRHHELKCEPTNINMQDFAIQKVENIAAPGSVNEDDLEARFVNILATILHMASRKANATYLNQAQRAALDALGMMASAGSTSAASKLVTIADITFTMQMNSEKGQDEHASTATPTGTIIQAEASRLLQKI